jgi:hypothetical protein
MSERIEFTRGQLARIGSLAGGVGLLAALALLVWQAGMSIASWIALGIGMLGIGLWLVYMPAENRQQLVGRVARYGGGSLVATLVLAGAIIAAYVWADGQDMVVDMTLPQTYTLSPPVRDVLDQLDRPIQITGFYSAQSLPQQDQDDAIFRLFQAYAPDYVRIVYIDPTAEPVVAERFGMVADGSSFVSLVDEATGEPDLSTVESISASVADERTTADAILRLLAAGEFTVYFTTGHGEPDTQTATLETISGIFEGLAAQGIRAVVLDAVTLADRGVPTDASAVIIPGARTRFSVAEVAALDGYMAAGGSLLVAANAPLTPEDTFLDAADPLRVWLRDYWGIVPQDDLVVDEASSFQNAVNPVSAEVIMHGATERIGADQPLAFFGSRSLEVLPFEDQPETMANAGRAAIVFTTEDAYGETNLEAVWNDAAFARDDADRTGPLALVAVAQNIETNARLIVTGDSDFLRNNEIGLFGNRFFYTDALGWLTDFFEAVEIDPINDPTRLPIAVTAETLNQIFAITVLFMPVAVLVVGFIVWTRRQRR